MQEYISVVGNYRYKVFYAFFNLLKEMLEENSFDISGIAYQVEGLK